MIFIAILLIIISVVLGFFVLIQNPKGGGLQQGSSASSMLGVQRTGDFLEKGSWGMMIVIVVLSILLTTLSAEKMEIQSSSKSKISDQIKNMPAQAPNMPISTAPTPKQGKDSAK